MTAPRWKQSCFPRQRWRPRPCALYAMGDTARAQHPLLAERHDVIVEGALILLYIMRGMGIRELHVSDADGMEGYRAYLAGEGN